MTSLLVGAGKPFLSKSTCVLSFLTIKIKFVDKMKQSDNLSVILHVRHKKLTVISVFSWFLILSKIKEGSQDGDHV